MFAQHILTTALLAVPAERTPVDPFESQLDQVELVRGDDEAQLIAYDSMGEVVGTIAIWADASGRIFLASDYGDGYAQTVVADDQARTEATLPPEIVATRAGLMLGRLAGPGTDTQAGWFECGVGVASTVAACAAAQPLLCPLGAAAAACSCIPLMIKEFKDMECL